SAFGCRGIPYRFISGERAVSGYFVQFMIDVLEWAQEDFLYERLGAVIENPIMTFQNLEETEESVALKSPLTCYNKFLRQGIAWGSNRYSECIERVEEEEAKREKYAYFLQFLKDAIAIFANQPDCGEMYRRLFNFAGKYTYARNMERQQIVPVLKEQIAILNQVSKQVTQDEKFHIIKERLQKLVIKSDSDNAAVNIIKIQDLEVLERPYNYVIGLSAGQFMVDTNESPVLSDEELIRYLNGNIQLAGETGRYVRENLLRTFATLEAGEITLGYSTFDTIELKKSSPSVFYLDYLERFGKMQGQIDYFTYDIQNGVTRVGLPSYNQLEAQEIPAEDEGNMQVTMSSSGLQTLIECPLRYYYHYIEKLPRREFLQKKEYQWLDAGTKGNLFHRTMELYCNRVLMNESVPEEYAKKNVFEEIYDSVVKELLEKIPYASEALFEQEKEEGRQLIWQYLQDFQKELYTDHIQGEEKWRVLGCEQQFQQIVYQVEDPKQKDSPLTILFEGTIDRLDGYVDAEGCLYLRVIDYKTGSIKKKQEALKSNKQIQHFVYAIAAIEYAVENRDILNELFNTDIRVICVKSAQYVFPYEGSKEKVLDVTEALYANLIDDRFALPESVRDVLWNTLGLLNCGKRDLAWKNIIEYPNKEDQKQGACECEYCSYTRQCRKKLGADL
ncbi:MAG: PD-(D/E)XK nuclease family protein, partial [Lachnospiraceae bacterium]|nr:PD-(D/E)XK nuclease family protein [Lachnospiraceae bacterium]